MQNEASHDDPTGSGLIRLGGIAILVGLAIHLVLNVVLKQMPPDDPSLDELQMYLSDESRMWALIHGMRYVACFCIALFAAALFVRTSPTRINGWAVMGLLGFAVMLASLFVTNGIETFVFLDFALLSENEELFYALFYTTRVLFTAEIAAWAIVIFGFSAAGWSSRRLPRWLAGFGLIPATAGLASGVFVVSIMTEGAAGILIEIAALSGLAWFASAGVFLTIRGGNR